MPKASYEAACKWPNLQSIKLQLSVSLGMCAFSWDFADLTESHVDPKAFSPSQSCLEAASWKPWKALAYYCRQAAWQVSYTPGRGEKSGPTLTCTYTSLYRMVYLSVYIETYGESNFKHVPVSPLFESCDPYHRVFESCDQYRDSAMWRFILWSHLTTQIMDKCTKSGKIPTWWCSAAL